MADAVETLRVVDRDALPEELAGYDYFGKNEHGRFVGFREGEAKVVQSVGDILGSALLELGAVEEVEPEPEASDDPEKAELRKLIKQLEGRVDRLERRNKELEDLLEGKTPPEPQAYEGFERDNEVGIKRGDKYEVGYQVIGFTPPDTDGRRKIRIEKDGEERTVSAAVLKHRAEIGDEEIAADNPPPAAPEPRSGRPVRAGFMRRARAMLPAAPEPPEYRVDDRGYYKVEDGREVVVTREEAEGRRLGAGALVLAGVVGIAAWELIGEKIFGFGDGSSNHLKEVVHNQSTIINNQGLEIHDLQKLNHHLTQVQEQMTAQHAHQHRHDLAAIHGLHNQIQRDHAQEMRTINELKGDITRGGFRDHIQNSGAYWGMRYPWDWAANKVGAFRAEGWLHTLAAKAAQHGHKIRWLTGGHGTEILQVDGKTSTNYVVDVLAKQ